MIRENLFYNAIANAASHPLLFFFKACQRILFSSFPAELRPREKKGKSMGKKEKLERHTEHRERREIIEKKVKNGKKWEKVDKK